MHYASRFALKPQEPYERIILILFYNNFIWEKPKSYGSVVCIGKIVAPGFNEAVVQRKWKMTPSAWAEHFFYKPVHTELLQSPSNVHTPIMSYWISSLCIPKL